MRRAWGGGALLVLAAGMAAAQEPVTALLDAGHWKRARAAAEARYKANPNDAVANYLLGRVRLAQGNHDEALKLAEKAAQLAPRNADYRYLVSSVVGEQAAEASIFRQMGLARRFKREAEAVLQLDPNHLDARFALMVFYVRAPGIVGGDKKQSQQMLAEIRKIDPARGYLAEIRLAREEKRTVNFEALYKKALEADPKQYSAHMSLVGIYGSDQSKKYDLAERHAREAMKIDAGQMNAYGYLASLYASQERWAELDAILADAEKNVPDNLNPYYQASRILLQRNTDLPRAERYIRKYLTQEAELGMPSHAAAHWRLGLIHEKQGRKADAVAALQASLRLDPKFEPAKNDLKRLK